MYFFKTLKKKKSFCICVFSLIHIFVIMSISIHLIRWTHSAPYSLQIVFSEECSTIHQCNLYIKTAEGRQEKQSSWACSLCLQAPLVHVTKRNTFQEKTKNAFLYRWSLKEVSLYHTRTLYFIYRYCAFHTGGSRYVPQEFLQTFKAATTLGPTSDQKSQQRAGPSSSAEMPRSSALPSTGMVQRSNAPISKICTQER